MDYADVLGWLSAIAIVLAILALLIFLAARTAERRNPPIGQFLDVGDVKLHYVDRGHGPPIVLLHGNITMLQDYLVSGILTEAAKRYRVIAIDRPGFGYSDRPDDREWTPEAQARVIAEAIERLGAAPCIVVGHSWGCLVAIALAEHHTAVVRSLVLLSGFYFPRFRFDALMASLGALPIIGDVLRYTITPIYTAVTLPMTLRAMFGPEPVPARFHDEFPTVMLLRPWQLRASLENGALTVAGAAALSRGYADVKVPAIILAGSEDRIVTTARQSDRLHDELPANRFEVIPGAGHMLHYAHAPRVLAAIDEAVSLGRLT